MLDLRTSSLLGAEHPRVELIPPASDSFADPAIRLAALAGMTLEPWQASGLRTMLAVRPDQRWAAFEYGEMCPRQNGKSAMFMARALAGLLLLGEHLILWSAHEYKTTMRSFLDLQSMIATLGVQVRDNLYDLDGILVKVDSNHGHQALMRLDTGAMIKMIARSKGSARGFSADCILIDEAFAFTSAQQSALMPTMQARPNPQICYASSPPLDRWSGEPLFALRDRALRGDAELAWRDWGIGQDLDAVLVLPDAERAALLDDRDLWAAANPALGRGRVTEESILRSRRAMSDEGFAREVLGMWPLPADEAGGKISPSMWAALAAHAERLVGPPVLAIDATEDGATACILLAARRADGLAQVELIDERPGAGLGWTSERVAELTADHHPLGWMIDPTGPAAPVIPDLQARGVEVTAVSGREYVQACGGFYDAVLNGRLRHLGDPLLADGVRVARARDVGDGGWAWARRRSAPAVARVCGATLALHGLLVSAATGPSLWL